MAKILASKSIELYFLVCYQINIISTEIEKPPKESTYYHGYQKKTLRTWLPVKSISRFRYVSINCFNKLFQNPNFIKLQLKYAIQMSNYNLFVIDYAATELKRNSTLQLSKTIFRSGCRIAVSQVRVHIFRSTIWRSLGLDPCYFSSYYGKVEAYLSL